MRTFSVAHRLIRQIISDKRTIALLFVAPLFLIYLLSIILSSSASTVNIDIVSAPEGLVEYFDTDIAMITYINEGVALNRLEAHESDAYLIYRDGMLTVTVEGTDSAVTHKVLNVLSNAHVAVLTEQLEVLSMQMHIPQQMSSDTSIDYLYGSEDMELFDRLAPIMMGYFIFFFVFLLAGISFLRERISGTLDRILATPLKRSELVWGYFFGFGLFITLQTVVIQMFMLYVLNVHMAGSFWTVLLINLLLAGGSLALGTLLSAFATNEFQLFQFIPLVIIPQILFSGMFDMTEAPNWVHVLERIFPMTYGAEALQDVMIRGYDYAQIADDLIVLFAYMILFLMLNILALKKYRKL